MSILNKIISNKNKEILKNKRKYPINIIENSPFFARKCFSLKKQLKKVNSIGILSEFKRFSPSKGIRNKISSIDEVTKKYESYGISGISILTDDRYFLGKNEDLIFTRKNVPLVPLLRKDFIIDEYQIIYSKSFGADVILLISEILSKEKLKNFSKLAKELSLEIIMELNSLNELNKITDNIDIIGINNRNLKYFYVDLKKSKEFYKFRPKELTKISESGIQKIKNILFLKQIGFYGFLIGENFLK